MNKKPIMRYEKFLLEEREVPKPPVIIGEGIVVIKHNVSEVEACENKNQNKIIEALFCMVTELFGLQNMEMHTSNYSNAFFLITKDETDFNNQQGILSPELSREKLKYADAKEIAGAIIDLCLTRDKWNRERFYRSLNSSQNCA